MLRIRSSDSGVASRVSSARRPDSRSQRYSTSPLVRSTLSCTTPASRSRSRSVASCPAPTVARLSRSEVWSRRDLPTAAANIVGGTLKRDSAAMRKSGAAASGSAAWRRPARRRRTSGRSYRPAAPLERHGIPSMLRLRPISTLSTFARTSTAWSRARRPPAMESRISVAIQSASFAVVRKRRNVTGAASPGMPSGVSSFEMPNRTSSRSGSLKRIKRRAAVRTGPVLR